MPDKKTARSSRPGPKERVLLYSIWLVIALSAGIAYFWPRVGVKSLPAIQVMLAPELQSWFSNGILTGFSNQGISVELKFLDKPLSSLTQVRSVQLGYDLGREKDTLFRGTIQWNPAGTRPALLTGDKQTPKNGRAPATATLPLTLPNPQGTVPKWIRLYFADSR